MEFQTVNLVWREIITPSCLNRKYSEGREKSAVDFIECLDKKSFFDFWECCWKSDINKISNEYLYKCIFSWKLSSGCWMHCTVFIFILSNVQSLWLAQNKAFNLLRSNNNSLHSLRTKMLFTDNQDSTKTKDIRIGLLFWQFNLIYFQIVSNLKYINEIPSFVQLLLLLTHIFVLIELIGAVLIKTNLNHA